MRASRPDVLHEVTQLLFREAYLLDRHRFDEWLALFTDDATYWVPLEEHQRDALETSSIIYDDRLLLELRVQQYRDARAHSRFPLARTCHQVGNVMLLDEDHATALTVSSTLVLVEYRNERQRVFAGAVEHRLRRTAEGMRIAAKRVDIVNSESELDGIAILF